MSTFLSRISTIQNAKNGLDFHSQLLGRTWRNDLIWVVVWNIFWKLCLPRSLGKMIQFDKRTHFFQMGWLIQPPTIVTNYLRQKPLICFGFFLPDQVSDQKVWHKRHVTHSAWDGEPRKWRNWWKVSLNIFEQKSFPQKFPVQTPGTYPRLVIFSPKLPS